MLEFGDSNFLQVGIRIRPLNDREQQSAQHCAWSVLQENHTIYPVGSDGRPLLTVSQPFSFDRIFEKETTKDIYEQLAKELIMSAVQGFNATIFAYGQTSSGKTFTMQGTSSDPGIIPLAVSDIFGAIVDTPGREFLIRVSYLEIYNEIIKDLLNPERDNLKIHETPDREIFVGNLTEEIVLSPEDVSQLLIRGERNRHVGVTNMNERSSRSHTIFRMIIESRQRPDNGCEDSGAIDAVRVSVLNLVDLAGSERAGQTGAEGIRLKEGGHINKSLLALSSVIQKLYEGNDTHIPYRDSKLTRILQPSLGGNAKTAIICTITPANRHFEDSLSTLKFASRAKAIRNKPEMNEIVSDQTMLKRYRKEINSLKRQLEELQTDEMQKLVQEKLQVEAENEKYQQETNYLQEKIEKMTSLILNDPSRGVVPKRQKTTRRQTWFPGAVGFVPLPEAIETELAAVKSNDGEVFKADIIINNEEVPARRSFGLVSEQKRIIAELKKEVQQKQAEKEALLLNFERYKEALTRSAKGLIEGTSFCPEQITPEIKGLHVWAHGLIGQIESFKAELSRSKMNYQEQLDFLSAESDSFRKSYEELETRSDENHQNYRNEVSKNSVLSDKLHLITEKLERNEKLIEEQRGAIMKYQTDIEKLETLSLELESHRLSLTNKSEELNESEICMSKLQTENSDLKAKVERLNGALTDCQSDLKSKSDIIEEFAARLCKHSKIIEELGNDVDGVFCELDCLVKLSTVVSSYLSAAPLIWTDFGGPLKYRLKNLEESLTGIDNHLADIKSSYITFEGSLRNSVSSIIKQKGESNNAIIMEYEAKLCSAKSEIEKLHHVISDKVRNFEMEKQEAAVEYHTKIKIFEKLNGELVTVNEELSNQIKHGKAFLASEQKKITGLLTETENLKSRITDIQSCRATDQQRLAELEVENKNLQIYISEGKSFVDKVNCRIESLESEKLRFLAEADERQKETHALQQAVRDLTSENSELSRLVKDLQKRCQELDLVSVDLEKSEINLAITVKENKKLAFELAETLAELKQKDELCSALKQANTFDQHEMDEQRKLNSQLESRVANLSAESNSLIEEKSALEQQISSLDQGLLALKSQSAQELSELKSNYHGQIDRLREQLTAAELSLQKALNDKDSYVERLQANCAKLMNEEVESDDATCSTSEIRERFLHKITLMEAEKSAQDDRLLKLQDEAEGIRQQLVIAKNHLEQERRASSDRDGKLKALSRECQALTESELSLRQTLHQKNTEISHLHQQLRRVVEEQHESKSSMTNTIEEDEIQMQSEGVESRVQLLQGQLENAKAEIASAKKEIRTVALLKSQESTRVSQLEVELNRTAVERDNLIKELQRYRDKELLINEKGADNDLKQQPPPEIKHFTRTFSKTNQENKSVNSNSNINRPAIKSTRSSLRSGNKESPDIPESCNQQ